MSSPASKITTKREYEKFLRTRGFSKKQATILASAWDKLRSTSGSKVDDTLAHPR